MKIAIVGSGISGLVTAWLLHGEHEITVFEADHRIGGHTHTVPVTEDDRELQVDTGFIVFNEAAYPNFCKLLSRLGVESQPSDMSFGVSCERTGLEYAGTNYNTLFAQRRNLLRPSFHRMLRDVVRFNRTALMAARNGHGSDTLADYLQSERYSREFVEHYILPMGAAVWSTEPRAFGQVPLKFFVEFFNNHGMLAGFDRPTWRVIRGGSFRYVEKLIADFRDRIHTSTPVLAIRRHTDHVAIQTGEGPSRFDQVIIAAHSDQALRMLADATTAEREILGAIRYQKNDTVLHTDTRVMPRLKRAWSSWNYRIPKIQSAAVNVSYHMNRLQALNARRDYIVTLNNPGSIDDTRAIKRIDYHHPRFDAAAFAAQQRHAEISGVNRTHYCGAYWGHGFHEDGVNSGLAVAKCFGRGLEA